MAKTRVALRAVARKKTLTYVSQTVQRTFERNGILHWVKIHNYSKIINFDDLIWTQWIRWSAPKSTAAHYANLCTVQTKRNDVICALWIIWIQMSDYF